MKFSDYLITVIPNLHAVGTLVSESQGSNKMLKQSAFGGQYDKKKKICVNVQEIRNNKYDLSISRYKLIEYVEVEYEKPDVIMEKDFKPGKGN